jgi:hypothetical protein
MNTTIRRFGAALGVVVFAATVTACRYTGFDNGPSKATAASAVEWLRDQQKADGGFEVAGFPGFETPDAVLAIAENAQQQAAWDTTQARRAVQAAITNGHNPLHAIDNFVDGPIDAGQAAKIIVLVAKPLGLSVTNFNPDGDAARNLIATVNAGAATNGSYGAFNATLYAAMAKKLVDGAVPAKTVSLIRAAQEPFGGWDFNGAPAGNDADIDTTSIAIAALAAAGVPGNDPDLRAGLAYLANAQRSNGAFQAFGNDDPNSTSSAVFAIVAAGFDPTSPCWRRVAAPGLAGRPYTSPIAWLRSQQITATGPNHGRIKSPNDAFGVNTFATSQTVQALRYAWIPVSPLAPQDCP